MKNGRIWFMTLVVALGGFLFGFDLRFLRRHDDSPPLWVIFIVRETKGWYDFNIGRRVNSYTTRDAAAVEAVDRRAEAVQLSVVDSRIFGLKRKEKPRLIARASLYSL